MADTVVPLRPVPASPRAEPPPAMPVREPLWRHLVGDELRQARHERGETLGQTARRAGVSPQYLSEMERGVKEPSSEMVAAVVAALDLTLLDLTEAVTEGLRTAHASRLPGGPTCRATFALAA